MDNNKIVFKDTIQNITYYTRDSEKQTIYIYFRVNSKTYRLSTGKTSIQEATSVGNKKYHLAEKGQEVRKIPLTKLLEKFFQHKKNHLAPKTLQNYERSSKYLVEYFKSRDITTIKSKSLIGFENWRRDYYLNNPQKQTQTYKRNNKTIKSGRLLNHMVGNREINMNIGLLISVMKYGCDVCGYISANQVPRWKRLKENQRESFLTEEDFLKIYRYFENKNIFYADILGFAFYTGVRVPSELNNLRWEDVRIEDKFVIIRDRKHKSKVVNSSVPLFPRTIKILERIKKRNNPQSGKNYVFTLESGKQVQSIRKSFNTAVKECGLDENLTLYSLRHGFATHLIENYNIPLQMISRIMGHSDTQMLQKVYSHLRDDIVIKTALFAHDEAKKAGKTVGDIDQHINLLDFMPKD